MNVHLKCEPRKTVDWDEFRRYPEYSIAIDGYCSGPPRSSDDGLRLNINHHEDCDRIATRSSCAQAFHLVQMGLYDAFSSRGRPRADLYVNDCDQDVQWTTYALMNPAQIEDPRYKFRIKEMINLEDVLDMSAGLYPIKKRWHLLKRLLWVSEPYTIARADGSLHQMDGPKMHALLGETHRRIRATLSGRGKELEPDDRFEVIADFDRWQFIREIGMHARIGIAQKGLKAFVSMVSSGHDCRRYVIVRRSRFIRWFPLDDICRRLNEAEGIVAGDKDRWGGSDNVIGSPRQRGSKLREDAVLTIVKDACDQASYAHA
ncbi:MAG TPA: hypothetical protein VL500_06845 [Candidatus Eisenbacteria bacterium]|nr:hypothetical protein [Candidatus Eisenbacteria bacterium]